MTDDGTGPGLPERLGALGTVGSPERYPSDGSPVDCYVAAVSNTWLGDLDVGAEFVRRHGDDLRWPPGTLVEPVIEAAQRFLHRLQELAPRRLVVVGAYPRGDAPATVRVRPRPDPVTPAEVQARLAESVGGVVDLDHLLAVAGYFGALPAWTTVIEVEPASTTFGGPLSPAVDAALVRVVDAAVRAAAGVTAP